MKKNIARQMAKGARIPVATALSLVLAFGCMPAVALAEEESALEAQDITSSAGGGQTVEDTTGTFSEINSTDDHGLKVTATTNNAAATVNGSVTVEHDGTEETCAVNVTESYSSGALSAEATVGGDVAATGKHDAYGVKIDNGTNGIGKLSVKIDGSVKATSNDASPVGVGVGAWTDKAIEVRIGGSVYANNTRSVGAPVGVKIQGSNYAYATVVVGGDITAETAYSGTGISINTSGSPKLVVGGTVSGQNGIETTTNFVNSYLDEISKYVTGGKTSKQIAVWQIKADGGNLVYVQDDDDNASKTKTLLGMIDYIVKYGDGQKEYFSELSADKDLGGVSIGTNEYQTAKSGTALTFSVPDRAGYTLKQVFGLDGGTALTRNADGSYTLVVPDGGGILLRAEWEKVQNDDPDPTEPPEDGATEKEEEEPETKAMPAKEKQPGTKAASTSTSGQANGTLAATWDPIPVSALVLVSVISLACMIAAAFARKAAKR